MLIADKINLAIAIAAGLSVLVSAIMAVMTYAMVKANRAVVEMMSAQIEATSRPHVQISPIVRPMSTAVELRIRNTGSSSAIKLLLTLDRDYYFNAEEGAHNNLRNYIAFSKEIQTLPPGAELQFLLGVGHRILSNPERCPLQFAVKAEYSYEQRSVIEQTVVDLEPFGKSVKPVDPMIERMDRLIASVDSLRDHPHSIDS